MRIAIYENNGLCDFFNARQFVIWEKGEQGWTTVATKDFEQITPSTPAKTRQAVTALLPLTTDCVAIAGANLTGIPYTVFDLAGKHIFQIREVNTDILDGIIYDISSAVSCPKSSGESEPPVPPLPTETAPGVFDFDLIEAQRNGISSKVALKNFLETTNFTRLNLKCNHIPPWIERDYNAEQEPCGDFTITKRA